MKHILSLIPTVSFIILAVISVACAITRNSAIADQAWDLHLEKMKSKRKEEPHEDS